MFSSTAIEILKWVKKNCSSASKGDPHLEAWESVGEDTERTYSAKYVLNIEERVEKKKGLHEREKERERGGGGEIGQHQRERERGERNI
jgi:hypothetical protein